MQDGRRLKLTVAKDSDHHPRSCSHHFCLNISPADLTSCTGLEKHLAACSKRSLGTAAQTHLHGHRR